MRTLNWSSVGFHARRSPHYPAANNRKSDMLLNVYIVMHKLAATTLKRNSPAITRILASLLICSIVTQSIFADSITYQQLRQEASVRPRTAMASTITRKKGQTTQSQQGQGSQPRDDRSAPVAVESPNRPEFVRLPDGRIVRYGPGVICDENCVEPVTPAAFREPGPRWWWIVAPLAAGGILCAILCRPGGDSEPLTRATILIPASPVASPTLTSTASPGATPPEQIPEPGTVFLFGSGLAALLLRKRMKAKANQQ